MKTLKYILILLLILIIGGAVYFSLKDGTYEITETRVIEAPAPLVFDQIDDFKEWENWNPWQRMEGVSSKMGEQTAGVDGYYTFTDEYGKGKMTFTGIDPDKSVKMDMFYDSGMAQSNSKVIMDLEQVENGTQVTWSIKGEQGLMEKVVGTLFGIDMEEEIRPEYKKGLENLDNYVTAAMEKFSINVDGITETGGGYHLYMSSSASMDNFSTIMSQMMQNIMSYMNRNDIDMYGNPMSIYEKFEPANNSVIFSAAIPVRDRVITETDSNVLCSYQEPGKAVKVTLKGSYDNLRASWQQGEDFILQNGLEKSTAPPFEVYKTDPMLTPNPADYITEIYIPIL
jgi:effector-binding domain-containing protein